MSDHAVQQLLAHVRQLPDDEFCSVVLQDLCFT